MAGHALLAELRATGVQIVDLRSEVVLRGKIPPRLAERARENKAELLAALRTERLATDPRADLEQDHRLWERLLTLSYYTDGHDPGGVHMALHGVRCLGAGLARAGDMVTIVRGEIEKAEYRDIRARYLLRHVQTIKRLLEQVDA